MAITTKNQKKKKKMKKKMKASETKTIFKKENMTMISHLTLFLKVKVN